MKPLFDEKDLISEWKNYKWLASGFMQMTFNGFYAAFSAKDHLIWMMMSEENQNLPDKITALSRRIFNNPEKNDLIQQKKSLEARLSNIEVIEEKLANCLKNATLTLNRLFVEHRSNLVLYKHKAKQEIDHLDAYGNLGMIQRVIYPEAQELYNQMRVFWEKFCILNPDKYDLYREQTHEEFNLIGFSFLQNIVETYQPEEKASEKIEEPDEFNLDGLDLTSRVEQISLLHELGVISYLREKYPNTLGRSNNQLAIYIAKILKSNDRTIQKIVNPLINNAKTEKNYPKTTKNVLEIMNRLNANESI